MTSRVNKTLTRRHWLTVSVATATYLTSWHRLLAGDPSWLAEVQTPPDKLPADTPNLPRLLVDGGDRPIKTRAQWERQRSGILKRWRDLLGEMKAQRDPGKPPKLTVLAEDRVEGVLRQRVTYEVEPGLATEAYLLRPAAAAASKRPGVVVFHSTVDHSIHQPAGVKGEASKAFGLQLAKAGCVAFCPRNFLWPVNDRIAAKEEAEKFLQREPRCLGMTKMLFDGQVALDILAAQPDVDPARLGTVGHSLGAKEALYLAAFDERVKCAVSSEGGVGIKFSNWEDLWYLGPRVKESLFPREHHELVALVAPRAFLLIGGDSADGARSWPFIAAALPVYKLYGEPPRVGLFNHKAGHSVPASAGERILAWCAAYL